jgi:transcriptional regulator with XRE-family HTH domain
MPRGDDYAARVRAARAYADLDRVAFGERLGFSKETVSRIESGERSIAGDSALLAKIAVACGVPHDFMEVGFSRFDRPISDVERELYALREAHEELAQQVGTLAQIVEKGDGMDLARIIREGRPRSPRTPAQRRRAPSDGEAPTSEAAGG